MAPASHPSTATSPEEIFLAHLPHIERVAVHAGRRRGLSAEETEEFVSSVRLKILEDDYAVLRKYKGQSRMDTYLTMVVQNAFYDYLNHLWGKWRPTAEADRLGPLAVQWERLRVRDGLGFEEACEVLRTNQGVEASRVELAALEAKLPPRNPPRRMEDEEKLQGHAADCPDPEAAALDHEAGERKKTVLGLLREALGTLPPEDRLIARMSGDFKVAEIARALKLDQKPLYRRLDRVFRSLREELERRGVESREIQELLRVPDEDEERFRGTGRRA
jgi:RNA polymerase sigma factor (sigma-70 family)